MRSCATLLVFALFPLTSCGSGDGVVPASNSDDDLRGADSPAQANASAETGSVTPNAAAAPQSASSAGQEPAAGDPIAAAKTKLDQSSGTKVSPCMTQDGKALGGARLRAAGTEPFWSASIEGRCVTYAHPDDQDGTRVWTRASVARGGGSWSGTLEGRRFELRVTPEPGCSDGMSDKKYSLAAELTLGSERRVGCAEPL
jgi:uncharacterized membrane protein